MIKNITFCEFVDNFQTANRENNFSYEGKRALFDYLEEYEESTREKIELDIIALCCEYTEYENIEEYLKDYETEEKKEDYDTEEEFKEAIEEEINQKTTLIKFNDDLDEGFIIQSY